MGIKLVQQFNKKFNLPDGSIDRLSYNQADQEYRLKFIQEELNELALALDVDNRVEAFDALLDLAYVVYGTALFMGITPEMWNDGMLAVHRANMRKVRVTHPSQSKRGSNWDLRKPEGWVGPGDELQEILED